MLSLFGDDGVTVCWTPASSAHNQSIYVVYTDENSTQVSALSLCHTLRGLVFGNIYRVSMAARSDFESQRIGPKYITIGKFEAKNFHTLKLCACLRHTRCPRVPQNCVQYYLCDPFLESSLRIPWANHTLSSVVSLC